MNKKNLRRIAAGLILFAFSIGMLTSLAGTFMTSGVAEAGDDTADDWPNQDQVVDYRIDEPAHPDLDEYQVVDYRIDTPSDESGLEGEAIQVVEYRIDTPW